MMSGAQGVSIWHLFGPSHHCFRHLSLVTAFVIFGSSQKLKGFPSWTKRKRQVQLRAPAQRQG
jgi:hypothetical protein